MWEKCVIGVFSFCVFRRVFSYDFRRRVLVVVER